MATNNKFLFNKKLNLNPSELFTQLTQGNISALSRAITLVESNNPNHTKISNELISYCNSTTSKSLRIGITGVPGVGKSTFIESFGEVMIKENKKLAILAIDPSSQQTGGSILGDKTRMEELGKTPNVFIRPSPSGKTLGGVARSTRESILLCEAAGFDIILIETVGVGQSETEVHSMVDFFLLLMLTGAGDELQGIKRGIMEMADLVVINKADGNNTIKAKSAQKLLQSALHYLPPNASNWHVKTLTCSSLENIGIKQIWENCLEYQIQMLKNGYLMQNRNSQNKNWFHQSISQHLQEIILNKPHIKELIELKEKQILNGELSPFLAAEEVSLVFRA
ncbi:MAG: methylmalonyl Co-A mutase-associated GTPase MeaB [Flavobacteriales bacterium]